METSTLEDYLLEKLEALNDDHQEHRVYFEAARILKGYFPNVWVAIEWLEKHKNPERGFDTSLINGVADNWDTVAFPMVSLDWFLRQVPDGWAHPFLELPQKVGLTRRLAGLAYELQEHYGENEFPLDQNALAAVLGVSQGAVSMALKHLVRIRWITRGPILRKDGPKCSYGRWLYRCDAP